ncbi:hypothetical protein [Flavobacterium rhizosphaerae]|uniref:Uncharacterized protein n=1 Tax=Flavobacterium rhizosphaerae TaxID=3163298 RepID=A0ABW8YSQ3_9FLAO
MKIAATILLILGSLYFGTGGLIYLELEKRYSDAQSEAVKNKKVSDGKSVVINNIPFNNKKIAEIAKDQFLAEAIYPYVVYIPTFLNFIITAISFGIIGTFAKTINYCITNNTKIADVTNLLLLLIQGACIGFIILGISYAIPTILTNEEVTLKPISIVFLSLIGGIFHEDFYKWLRDSVKQFKEKSKTE